jgi:hypothetical protein
MSFFMTTVGITGADGRCKFQLRLTRHYENATDLHIHAGREYKRSDFNL